MTDLRTTVIPKSDQLNADDLIGQTKTIKITKVLLTTAADQPIAIHYEGDGSEDGAPGKPFKPCKSMRRVLIMSWGEDGNKFVGRRMTLYRDDKVAFGGLAVGGIRISHLSHIDGPLTMALTATRGSRKPYTVKPLAEEARAKVAASTGGNLDALLSEGDMAASMATRYALDAFYKRLPQASLQAIGKPRWEAWYGQVVQNAKNPPSGAPTPEPTTVASNAVVEPAAASTGSPPSAPSMAAADGQNPAAPRSRMRLVADGEAAAAQGLAVYEEWLRGLSDEENALVPTAKLTAWRAAAGRVTQ